MIRGKGFIFAAIILAVDFFAFVTALSFFFTPTVTARTIENNFEEINIEELIEFAPTSESHNIIKFNIFEDIAKARELLEKRRCGFRTIRIKKGKKIELGEFTIILAVKDIRTREILVVRVHPKNGGSTGTIVVEPGKSNGVNTKFNVTYPENHIVLAIKRPVRHGTSFKEVTYTPYSEGLDIPEVREAGMKYLRNVLTTAKNDLTKRGAVPSSWETFFADDISFSLAIIEHIDPVRFESGKYTTEKLINETLVVLGANKQKAYRFSASKAGARGLFQFIPKTYKRIVDLYPQAGLTKDFNRGMEDHENAAKATLLLFDADMRIMNYGRTSHITDDPQKIGRLLASAYNCGSGKTKDAFEKHGDKWNSKVPTETQIYLKKFDAVWEWLHVHPRAVRSITIHGMEIL